MTHPIDVGIVTIIPREITALFNVFGIRYDDPVDPSRPLEYWHAELESPASNRVLRIVVTYITGAAGNTDAAITTTALLHEWRPRLAALCGIAAGVRGKVRIGDVVVAERVHDLCITVKDKSGEYPRGDVRSLVASVSRSLKLRPLHSSAVQSAMLTYAHALEAATAAAVTQELDPTLYNGSVEVHDGSIVSSNALLRDEGYFVDVRKTKDEKCRAGEMEAAGFTRACEVGDVPWVVIRGISDFGDQTKSDHFQELAAYSSAVALKTLLADTLDIDAMPLASLRKETQQDIVISTILGGLRQAAIDARWKHVVNIGSFFSRPLWLAGLYPQRVELGHMIEDAAAKDHDSRTRIAAMIDDIGWTSHVLDDDATAEKYITDGLRVAADIEDYYFIAKGNRHLASIARKGSRLVDAARLLEAASTAAARIANQDKRLEMETSLLLSRARLKVEQDQLAEARSLAIEAHDLFMAADDENRSVKVVGVLAQIEAKSGNLGAAAALYKEGALRSHGCGRFGQRDEYVFALAKLLRGASGEGANEDGRGLRALVEVFGDQRLLRETNRLLTGASSLRGLSRTTTTVGYLP